MKFLTIIVVVLVYRNWFGGNPIREVVSTDKWFIAVRDSITAPNLRYLVAVILPAVVLLWISFAIDDWFFGLLYLALSIAVLLFAIKIIDLDMQLFDFRLGFYSGFFRIAVSLQNAQNMHYVLPVSSGALTE